MYFLDLKPALMSKNVLLRTQDLYHAFTCPPPAPTRTLDLLSFYEDTNANYYIDVD